ncbi:MAG: hypothetical protein JO301_13785 [Chitinophagaceae bacterium]|nr:hypothetical protein [Chitinophagaceae bacterium]
MRKLFPQAVLLAACLYTTETRAGLARVNDTTKIIHSIDGIASEWKPEKFETDKDYGVMYAMDHDANFLYVVLKVPDQRTQMKLMMQGMNLYVDKKGKKREAAGVEFPIKPANPMGAFSRGNREEGAPMPDPKAVREALTANMIVLKQFGFEGQEDKLQPVVQDGSVNVSFDWDANNALVIEYLIPMGFVGKPADLNGKPLGIGWKINGITMPDRPSTPLSTSISRPGTTSGGGAGSRGGSRTGSGPSLEFSQSNDPRFKDQNFWTKYTVNF